ncbi:FecR family protein [Xanthomonas phaseoli]|uniref:FecR domain-containing protein n=13 Tax=Xanthomonas TaxID=338 RepID=A0A8I2BPS3_XANMN|nr:FecR domain-containing protein [Xanthomonas phaseoli]KUF20499.1 iron dicitrate transport regulator FecR [Xanthomonas phaseoli pv. manihotis]MBO9719377.1 FecR domain-containing protein [Xanthomonas phaseoli pv. manihotis]MBO9755646.1 FecR domain-containing protein [Xanthomonas phaseoli pv. manihotis]MBO9759881.1 FecR domain-containing protein [Xanthomonas phaseoli pv. manihotis]MBO9764385.1 FecR domain-containing protein [Xanthomonas phaseoli pv. manihotis]
MRASPAAARRLTEEAAHWHALQRMQPLDADQQARFMQWLTVSPAHVREYLAVTQVAGALGEALDAMALDVEALLQAERQRDTGTARNVIALPLPPRRAADAAPQTRRPQSAARRPRWQIGLAAMLALITVVGSWAWPRTTTYATAHGEQRRVQLADRSVVFLNADTRIQATMTPWSRRLQLLQGQASFDVAADRRPLQVRALGLRVEDIGTAFDIALHGQQARIDVSAGRVHVWRADHPAQPMLANLGAGQSARIDEAGQVEVSNEEIATMHAWQQQRIVFRDEPLRNVAEDFNRLNRIQLHIDDARAGAMRLTGNLRSDDLAGLQAFLARQPGLRLEQHADAQHIVSRAPQATTHR